MEIPTVTQQMRGRPVTHEEGAASIQRLINSHFNNENRARCSIPVRADDDDILASDYAQECAERIAKLEAENARLESDNKALRDAAWVLFESHCLNTMHTTAQMCPICVDYFLATKKEDRKASAVLSAARAAIAQAKS